MSFSMVVNILTSILCGAVLVQSVRMMRSLQALRGGAITEVVTALDRSTQQARAVLSELKVTLAECAHNADALADGKAICDELTVMVGIANATADRMADAAKEARNVQMQMPPHAEPVAPPQPQPQPKPQQRLSPAESLAAAQARARAPGW